MEFVKGGTIPQIKNITQELHEDLKKKYPDSRNFKFSLKEDIHSYYTTTLEIRVGKKKLMVKKIGASANESIHRAYSALKKRLEKSLQRKKIFLSTASLYA